MGRVVDAAAWWIPVVGDSEADLEDGLLRWAGQEAERVEAKFGAVEQGRILCGAAGPLAIHVFYRRDASIVLGM